MGTVFLRTRHSSGIGIIQRLYKEITDQESGKAAVVVYHGAVGLSLNIRTFLALFHNGKIPLLILRMGHAKDRCDHLAGILEHIQLFPQIGFCIRLHKPGIRTIDHLRETGNITSFLIVQIDQGAISVRDQHIAFLLIQERISHKREYADTGDIGSLLLLNNRIIRNRHHQVTAFYGDIYGKPKLIWREINLRGKSIVDLCGLNSVFCGIHIRLQRVLNSLDHSNIKTGFHSCVPSRIAVAIVLLVTQCGLDDLSRSFVLQNNGKSRLIEIQLVCITLCHQFIILDGDPFGRIDLAYGTIHNYLAVLSDILFLFVFIVFFLICRICTAAGRLCTGPVSCICLSCRICRRRRHIAGNVDNARGDHCHSSKQGNHFSPSLSNQADTPPLQILHL